MTDTDSLSWLDSATDDDNDDCSSYYQSDVESIVFPDNCSNENIVMGFIRIIIKPLLSTTIIPTDIKLLISTYYRYMPYINSSIMSYNTKKELIKLLCKKKLFKSLTILQNTEFKLLFNAQKHNFLAKEFHNKCDNVSDIIVIIKNATGTVFGYYTPPPFKNDKYYSYFSLYPDHSFYFRLECNIDEYVNIGSIYNIEKCVINDMKQPKIFDFDNNQCYFDLVYNINQGPSVKGNPSIKIVDQWNLKNLNECHVDYNKDYLGIELCGEMEEIGGLNCLNSWGFTIENYEVFQIVCESLNKRTDKLFNDQYGSSSDSSDP